MTRATDRRSARCAALAAAVLVAVAGPGRAAAPSAAAGAEGVSADSSGATRAAGALAPRAASSSGVSWVKQIGGPGRAQMYPSGVDVARRSRGANRAQAGRVFIADTGNDRVAAYARDGALLWRSGSRGHRDGHFSEPRDVAYLRGRVYVADTGNNRVQVLSAATGEHLRTWPTFFGAVMGVTAGTDHTGAPKIIVADGKTSRMSIHSPRDTVRRYVGSFGSGDGQLNEPRDGAFDSAGNLYVADFRNHRVAVFDRFGRWSRAFGSLGGRRGQFRGPYGIEIDDANGVYVADANNQRIQKLRRSGRFVRAWGSVGSRPGRFRQLRNVAVGGGARPAVFGVDLWGYKVEQWSQRGVHRRTFAGKRPRAGRFNKPHGLALHRGKVYVADTVHHRVQRFGRSGAFELSFGDRGWAPRLDGLNWPRGVAVDAARNVLWVADTKNWRVTEFTLAGRPTGVSYGELGSGDGGLHWPGAVAPVGNGVVIADTYNHRIVRWDPDTGTLWTATGFNFPKDVKVHRRSSTVYVADALNGRIVKLRLSDGRRLHTFGGTVLRRVEGVAVASDGDVWVADTGFNVLVEFGPTGTRKRVFGGRGSAHGKFWEPTNLQIRRTRAGDLLYVADTFNDRIEVFRIR